MHTERDPRLSAIPDIHGHAKGEHKPYVEERPLPLTARMLFLWFYHACRRGFPRFLMVSDHINYLTFEDPASVNLVRRALKLAQAGDLYGAAETANVDVGHAQVVSEGLRHGMRYSIGAEVDNDPRARPDAQNIVDAMRPDGLIRSVHFITIDHPVHGANWNWAFDNPEFASLYDHVGTDRTWESYMAVLLDAIERLPGNIVGHFFVPAMFGHWPDDATLGRYEDAMLTAAAARGMAVEFNTRFLYRDASDANKERYLAANRRLLRKAKERGVGIAIGSDAHSPRDQSRAFETVLAVLDELDINEIVFPIAGRLARVALRYVKPIEPDPPPPEPAPVVAAIAEPAPAPRATDDAATTVAKPVRKARPGASSTRPKETSPERAADRHADDGAGAPPTVDPPAVDPHAVDLHAAEPPASKPPATPSTAPAEPPSPKPVKSVASAPVHPPAKAVAPKVAPVAKPAAPVAKPATPVVKPAVAAAKPPVPPAKPAAKAAIKPVAKQATKPAAKAVVKAPPKAAKSAATSVAKGKPVKVTAKAKPASQAPATKAAGKAAAARRPVKSVAPGRKAVAKKATAKKAASKKAAPKKPVRVAAKPAAKKAAPKKPARAPAKRAPAKKTPARKPVLKKAAKKPAKRR